MRVVTYNVQSLRGSRSGVVAALREAHADVVCVQEFPRFFLPALRARRFARRCGLVALSGGRLAADVAIWVKQDVLVRRSARVSLSRTRGLHRRGVAVARLTVNGVDVTVASVHLGLDALERERHAAQLAASLVGFDQPRVVVGDVNEGPAGAAWQLLESTVGRAANVCWPTFPSREPRHTIDTAFVGAGLSVLSVHVPAATASDHRPVVVDLALPTRGAP
jgi:endonuclease/exonuclease/phosphatase family metal-dependent hydrolase